MNIQRGRGGEGGSARRGSLQPEPHDARRRQREPPEPRETGSGRRAPGVGAACSAPRSPCSPRDASPPRPPRRAPPCGRRRRCHVPGEARGGRSGDSADGLEEAEAEAAAGGGELGARARAHGGARLARPGHVPGRAGYEAGGAGGAATSALARAALGAAAAAAAVSSGPGERPGARAGRDWHPRHLPPAPACGARARVLIAPLLEGSREGAGSALHAGERAPSPAARYRRAGSGLQGPGVPSASGWKPRGLQAISGPFFPELFQSGRPSSPAGGGRRGCVCPGCRARSGADPACRARGAGPKGCGGGGRAGQGGGRGAGSPGPGVPFL